MRHFYFLLLLLSIHQSYGQTYTLSVDQKCAKSIAKSDEPGNDIDSKLIPAKMKVRINIEELKIKKITFLKVDNTRFDITNFEDFYTEDKYSFTIENNKWERVSDEMKYPYNIEILDSLDKSCNIVLGSSEVLEKVSDQKEKIKSDIDLLNQIRYPEIPINVEENYCDNMKSCNEILVLDCSTWYSAKSKLYRKSTCGNCKNDGCKKSLKKGDYLKVYLINFNPYKFDVEFNNKQIDIPYANGISIIDTSGLYKKSTTPGAISLSETVKDSIIKLILNYSAAVDQLKVFIESTKINTRPDGRILEINKNSIIRILSENRLNNNNNSVKLLYNQLTAIDQTKYESEFRNALQFDVVYYDFTQLSYSLETTILPVHVKSYDKLVVSIKLKDKKSKTVIREEEYEYLIRGGFKVDQSFGVALHTIRDQEFSLRSFMGQDTSYALKSNGERLKNINMNDSISSITPAVRKEIMQEESPSKYAIGVTTLTHMYYRFTGVFSVGPEVGISADIYPKTDLRYLFGLGLLFKDERHRISLDFGYAFGKNMVFSQGQNYGTILKGEQANPVLIEQHQKKLYIGISYNVPLVTKNTQDVK
ncbi:MAG: hypothetical protein IPJ51_11720 [Saprospiraceae bacterium]|nr:hypothetical protein [Saprospiraceae bacterium]